MAKPLVQIVGDALIEAIQLGASLALEFAVPGDRLQHGAVGLLRYLKDNLVHPMNLSLLKALHKYVRSPYMCAHRFSRFAGTYTVSRLFLGDETPSGPVIHAVETTP